MDIKKELVSIPHSPGVYFFYDGRGDIVYIGKAGNLRRRVSSYFHRRHSDPKLIKLVSCIKKIDYVPTSSNAEAMIYEASYIREKKPKFNVALKDDKSYPMLKLTVKEKYPRIMITRQKDNDGAVYYGPYTSVRLLRQALSFMKRIFPLRTCNKMPKKPCLNLHIGQCPGPCTNEAVSEAYKQAVTDIKLFLLGKRRTLIKRLTARMNEFSEAMQYEKALKARKQLESFSVLMTEGRHIGPLSDDLRQLKDALGLRIVPARIEAFDISNIHGKHAVGSMVCFVNAEPSKNDYRRFRIKTVNDIDDYAMIKEVIRRRYTRIMAENKPLPDLILIDGGAGHLNAALSEMKKSGVRVPAISIAKKEELVFTEDKSGPVRLPEKSGALKLLQRVRDEAHRFAISYHKLLRGKAVFDGRKDEKK